MYKKTIAALIGAALLHTTANAATISASPDAVPTKHKESTLAVGLGFGSTSSAYAQYDDESTAIPLIFFNSKNFYFEGVEGGYKVIENRQSRLSVFVSMGAEEFDAGNSDIDGLKDRDRSVMAGVRYRYMAKWGIVDAKVAGDISEESEGTIARVSYGYPFHISEKFTILPRGFVKWMSSDYADYYYGVSPDESGLSSYAPGSSMKYGAELIATYQINNKWKVLGGGRVSMLDSDLEDSPMMDDDMESLIFAGVTYKFW
ncbi:MipA/OmpV family protein [Neiella marina]|uniref:MipA/OmpV family protein n=1 Tax=Neiella holothuriorum TaxID=2870530 RepID=A0ABS7EC68_9GAMM|nr:MipA/OmpV family protein [Neiella holothuriorum]MBW8189928.1 MipA/OmpV family protein [Neiella holothuriorum]